MEEICGYKGKNGKFYQSKSECYTADLKYDLRGVEHTLNNLNRELSREIGAFHAQGVDIPKEFQNHIQNRFCEVVLRDSDKFIEIINKKEKLAKSLDGYKKKIKNHESILNLWWLKTKWW